MSDYLKPIGWIKPTKDGWAVGARDEERDYDGPTADVYDHGIWVTIETCPYEGSVMLNRETVPKLIEALQSIVETPTP